MSEVIVADYHIETLEGAQMPANKPFYAKASVDYPASFAQISIDLDANTPMPVYADGGAMIWIKSGMDAGGHSAVKMDSPIGCGICWDGCKRQCSGQACIMTEWSGTGTVAFSFKLPGDILCFGAEKDCSWRLNAGGYICGTNNLAVNIAFAGCAACCCGGEDPFFTHIAIKEECLEDPQKNNGVFWAGGYGALTRHEIGSGETMFLNQGLFFASNDSARAGVDCCIAGPIGCCCGNSGRGFLTVMKFEGPAIVYSQNKSPRVWQKLLAKPKGKANAGAEA